MHIPGGRTVAVFVGAAAAFVVIGFLNWLSEVSKAAKTFLIFSKATGPWSGKVTLGYGAGLAAWFLAWLLLRKRDGNIVFGFWLFFAALAVGTLLVFTPFLDLLV